MPREAPLRFSVTELDREDGFLHRVALASGLSGSDVRGLIAQANDRLLIELGLIDPPLQVTGGSLRANGVVGLLRLSQRVELEIAPKYLGRGSRDWRADFFFIANVSRFGRMFPADRLGTDLGGRNGLANLVARTLVEQYWDNHRRPLRTYRTSKVLDFDLVGEADPEDLVLPQPDGYPQSVTTFTRTNPYNGVILTAARQLLTEVDDSATRQQLVRVIEHLWPQVLPQARWPRYVPNRHRRWQPLYDLSAQVLDGFSLDLARGPLAVAPGFVLKSAKSWEDVLTRAARVGLRGAGVNSQRGHVLGTRNGQPFKATPDITIQLADRVLADAKYIGRPDDKTLSVDSGDVYEGLAFLRAAGCTKMALLYPRRHRPGMAEHETGTATLFETVAVGDLRIYAFEVEAVGISDRGGFRRFASGVGDAIRSTLAFT